jgi:hypothetical protein
MTIKDTNKLKIKVCRKCGWSISEEDLGSNQIKLNDLYFCFFCSGKLENISSIIYTLENKKIQI